MDTFVLIETIVKILIIIVNKYKIKKDNVQNNVILDIYSFKIKLIDIVQTMIYINKHVKI